MILLTAENITKSFSEKTLLKDISFTINDGDKIGVIGVNGAGKSTFLKIIAGLEAADSGLVTKSSAVRVQYLPQIPIFENHISVLEQVLLGVSSDIKNLKEYESKAILTKLGITDFDKNVNLLSGGQKKKVAIASALVRPAGILILDEPTNHIDHDVVEFLEKYLSNYPGAILMVTHDRYFLERVTSRIIEIENGNLFTYQANYAEYLELKAARLDMALSSERKRQSLLKKELAWMQRGARARSTKAKSRVERYVALKEQSGPASQEKLELGSISSRLGRKTIQLNGVSKHYGDNKLIEDFEYTVLRDDRIGIIGPNGCGKSTLLKMIIGDVTPDQGEIVIGKTVKIAYFSQECEEVDTSVRVIDYIRSFAENIKTADGMVSASQMLERFLFEPSLQWNTIGKLSGGERRRLFLLRLLMGEPNILLLDEPTNDLDIQTLSVLEDYLESFSGAVIVVSHDRYFLDRVVDKIFAYKENGIIKEYLGGYSDYVRQVADEPTLQEEVTEKKADSRVKTKSKKRKFTFKEQQEYTNIDHVIASLEKEISIAKQEIEENASNYVLLQALTIKKSELEKELDEKMARWVYLTELAEEIEGSS